MELFDWRRRAELPFVNRYEGLGFEVIGRVKPRTVVSQVASCWYCPHSAVNPAEYMNLGPIFRDEKAIRQWLAYEKSRFLFCTRPTSKYRGGDAREPEKLPE